MNKKVYNLMEKSRNTTQLIMQHREAIVSTILEIKSSISNIKQSDENLRVEWNQIYGSLFHYPSEQLFVECLFCDVILQRKIYSNNVERLQIILILYQKILSNLNKLNHLS